MKLLIGMLVAVFMVSGFTSCSQTLSQVDAIIQKGAPVACQTAAKIYNGWIGTNTGGARERAIVNATYANIYKLCKSPSTITAQQLYTVGNETVEMVKAMRK